VQTDTGCTRIVRYDYDCLALYVRPCSVNAYPYTSARPESRSGTRAGNCTVWSTGSSRTGRCRPTSRAAAATTVTTRSSARPAPVNTCPGPCSSTWSRPSWVRHRYTDTHDTDDTADNASLFRCFARLTPSRTT